MATAPKRKGEPGAVIGASSSQDLVNDTNSGRRQEQKVYTFNTDKQDKTSPAGGAAQAKNDEKAKPQKTILEEHGIILGKVIGTGNYAKVKIGFSEEYGKRVAVKIISKVKAPPEYTQKFLPREIEAVKGLHHDNLITFYQSIETSHRVYLIMQLAENGTLLDYVREKKFLDEAQSRKLFRQLISAVEYIHSKGVVHRDIKCENLLLDEDWNLKLIDFGFARKDTRSSDNQVVLSKTFCGSYAYASPEILKGVAYDPFMSDIWACGVVCYAMVFGRLPYDGSNVHILLKRINQSLVFPKSPPATSECKHMIMHVLAPVKIRYNVPQVKEDPWFTSK
ncbi:testis-specific serine/threonine-protein kinase 1 [Drosophila guanche]|uniref:Blast:Testis-specific serine/threonine-protein kinase 1 n=1 Tax=Drosophila guanche TaxID=7266 RepID=A0A3B0KD15_DROGU|nr:testis-specific serine/threonine-protein kinase 1 [Drosophila guanche]SPP86130.1 blast:Testis-specific serine/threonine-protein kinase 1 [Drosophila guanche]